MGRRRAGLDTAAKAAFLAALVASGNVTRAARATGASVGALYRERGRDGAFAARWTEALAQAGRSLAPRLDEAGVVRRGPGGVPQLHAPRAREWTAAIERSFLDALSATANVRSAAQAAGVSASGAWLRRRRCPAFTLAWDDAVDEGHARLELLLMERGTELLGGAGFGCDPEVATPERDAAASRAFDPHVAMWLLKRRDAARAGTPQRRGGWQPREPSIEEVRAEVLRKVAAMERAGRARPAGAEDA